MMAALAISAGGAKYPSLHEKSMHLFNFSVLLCVKYPLLIAGHVDEVKHDVA
jgi:hypothetical protein